MFHLSPQKKLQPSRSCLFSKFSPVFLEDVFGRLKTKTHTHTERFSKNIGVTKQGSLNGTHYGGIKLDAHVSSSRGISQKHQVWVGNIYNDPCIFFLSQFILPVNIMAVFEKVTNIGGTSPSIFSLIPMIMRGRVTFFFLRETVFTQATKTLETARAASPDPAASRFLAARLGGKNR